MPRAKVRQEQSAIDAALALGMSRERVIRLVQNRELKGRRDPVRGWLVDTADIARYEREHEAPTAA